MSPLEIAVAVAVMAVGALVHGSVGFGMNLIAAPILVLIDPAFVPGPMLVAALVLMLFVTWRERASMDVRGIRWAIAGRVPGSVLGAFIVLVLPRNELALALAAAVLVGVIVSAGGWHLRLHPPVLFGAGATSGLMATVTAIGGPPMALVYQREGGRRVRGTLSGFFLFGACLSLVLLAGVGRFGVDELQRAAVLIPGLLVGFAASKRTAPYLDAGYTRPAVLLLSSASAVAVVVRYLL